MSDRKFRFGIVAGLAPNAQAWTGMARRAEELGYSSMMIPDTLSTFEPFTALATAAAVTTTLRVGPFVLPAPFYTPSEVAWKAISLDVMSDGRLDLGLGAGRPGAEAEVVHRERAFGTPPERVGQLASMVRVVKEDFASAAANERTMLRPVQRPHPPILIAAGGRRMFALAAQEADMITLALPPQTNENGLAAKAAELREVAGSRFDDLEIAINLAAVGDDLPPWLSQQVGMDPAELVAGGGIAILTGTVDQMVDTLQRRRDTMGISYVTVSGAYLEQFAPVVERLAGT
jgi:probable F420-dependent oxidoreductase